MPSPQERSMIQLPSPGPRPSAHSHSEGAGRKRGSRRWVDRSCERLASSAALAFPGRPMFSDPLATCSLPLAGHGGLNRTVRAKRSTVRSTSTGAARAQCSAHEWRRPLGRTYDGQAAAAVLGRSRATSLGPAVNSANSIQRMTVFHGVSRVCSARIVTERNSASRL